MDQKGLVDRMKNAGPTGLAVSGIALGCSPWLTGSLYGNYFVGAGLTLLFFSWVMASWMNKTRLINEDRWENQKKAMTAMGLCAVVGLALLVYYEMHIPKYQVALISKELYRVPPQLNQKELRELGAECNTYGNTLCSHDVFAKIVKQDPRDFFALANLAMAQSHLGLHQHAVINFEKAIAEGVHRYDVYKFYGHSLQAMEKTPKAIEAYKASLRKNPQQYELQEKLRKLTSTNP